MKRLFLYLLAALVCSGVSGTAFAFPSETTTSSSSVFSFPSITTMGSLSALTTTYGTSSSNGAFSVSGANMSAGITVTAPAGFEVSTSPSGPFSSSILVGSAGTIPATTIYVRLAATTTPGTYSGNVSCSSSGATTRNVAIGSSTVNPAILTISGLTASNKTYDRTTAASLTGTAALNGIVGSDVVTLGGSPSATFASANAGTGIAVTVTGYTISGANAGNYTLTQPTGLTANITAKTLTVSGAVASNKTYDGTTNASVTGGTLTGVISPDVVTVSATGTFATANVGTGIIVALSLSGANAGNYTLAQPGITANITQAALTITANNVSKVYGTSIAGGSGFTAFTTAGLQNGETVGSAIIFYLSGSAAADPVGTYNGSVTVQSATGGTFSASNYLITYVPGNITVIQAALTITGLSGVNKVYDGTTTASLTGTATLNGVVGSDMVSLSGTPAAVFASKNVGTSIAITVSGYTLTGANAANYTLSQPTGLTGNITPKALTIVSPSANNKVYDGTTVATISGTLCGCVIGSDVVSLTLSGTFATKNVGTGIAVTSTSTLSGANAAN
ncbi:MAG: filamentous hemagglutinin, partial [Bacteroidetes bacterium]|nr:filamentous hemagglutinin [Bacteroidota bacterium]